MVEAAYQNGIYLFLDLLNFDDGEWSAKGQVECAAWGKFWGDRYARYSHINILLGEDNAPLTQANWIVSGVKQSMLDRLYCIDSGTDLKNPYYQKDARAKWINLSGWYSYEMPDANCPVYQYATWLLYTHATQLGVPVSPTLMLETQYSNVNSASQSVEGNGIPTDMGTLDEHVMRRQLWSVPLGGGSGWGILGNYNDCMHDGRFVDDPLFKYYANYCNAFFTARRWDLLAPDYGHTFLTSQAANPALHDSTYVSAAVASDGSFGVVYFPGVNGQANVLTINMSMLGGGAGTSTVRWFDPTKNTYKDIPGSPFANDGSHAFTTPGKNGLGNTDWVLVLEASSASATPPNKTTPTPCRKPETTIQN